MSRIDANGREYEPEDVLDHDEWGQWMAETGRWRRRDPEPLPVRRAEERAS